MALSVVFLTHSRQANAHKLMYINPIQHIIIPSRAVSIFLEGHFCGDSVLPDLKEVPICFICPNINLNHYFINVLAICLSTFPDSYAMRDISISVEKTCPFRFSL